MVELVLYMYNLGNLWHRLNVKLILGSIPLFDLD